MAGMLSLIELLVILAVIVGGHSEFASAQVGQDLASEIMGKNFLGVEEVRQSLGVQLTEEELEKVRDIPFSTRTLRECKDSHILFLGVGHDKEGRPLTISRLREMFPAGTQPRFRSYPKLARSREGYATTETPCLRWHLVARRLREESRSKPYWQQEESLRENEYRESAVVYVYMMLLMYKARGERLFEKDLVWCKNVGPDGSPVAAGYFDAVGLYVSDWWVRRDAHFGIAPARRLDSR